MNLVKTLPLAAALALPSAALRANIPVTSQVIFIVDSSNSVASGGDFTNWDNQLNFVAATIDNFFPDTGSSLQIGLINFAGNTGTPTYNDDVVAGRVQLEFGLTDFTTKADYLNYVNGLDETDFIGGRTHTDHAFQMALDEFTFNGVGAAKKSLVLLTTEGPSSGYAPVEDDGFGVTLSPTFQALLSEGVEIHVRLFDTDLATTQRYYEDMVPSADNLKELSDFDALDFDFGVVPEPGSFALLLGLFSSLLIVNRRPARN